MSNRLINHPTASGTRPAGARDESEAAARIREMFARIAPRYDLLNHLLSFSLDRVWRRRTAERFRLALARPGARALDLCCGTGDLTFALERAGGREARRQGASHRAQVVGSDFVHAMLTRAQQKGEQAGLHARFLEADALYLPFPDASFDLVTVAFGFRNLANYEAGLREMSRVLRQGGEVGILEFSAPPQSILSRLYRLYFTQVVPRVGGTISGSRTAYAYLPSSVEQFPSPDEFAVQMNRAGFCEARFETWMFGAVALHSARKT